MIGGEIVGHWADVTPAIDDDAEPVARGSFDLIWLTPEEMAEGAERRREALVQWQWRKVRASLARLEQQSAEEREQLRAREWQIRRAEKFSAGRVVWERLEAKRREQERARSAVYQEQLRARRQEVERQERQRQLDALRAAGSYGYAAHVKLTSRYRRKLS